MSEPENFVARWSRLKRENAKDGADAARPAEPATELREPDETREAPSGSAPAGAQPSPPFDEASLPPIESITAGSDIRAFLEKNVPAHLTRAALRRAWTTDPAIRDFIGIAENQWDFTDPNAMPGFGALAPADDVQRLVAQAMGKLGDIGEPAESVPPIAEPAPPPAAALTSSDEGAPTQAIGMPEQIQGVGDQGATVEVQQGRENAATQHAAASAESFSGRNRRGHGSALPK